MLYVLQSIRQFESNIVREEGSISDKRVEEDPEHRLLLLRLSQHTCHLASPYLRMNLKHLLHYAIPYAFTRQKHPR